MPFTRSEPDANELPGVLCRDIGRIARSRVEDRGLKKAKVRFMKILTFLRSRQALGLMTVVALVIAESE